MQRKKNSPTFSIIIPLHIMTGKFFEDLKKFNQLKKVTYEILVISDKHVQFNFKDPSIRLIEPQTDIKLGEKRHLGYIKSRGTYIAYIDDDAYPDKYWLSNALSIFLSDKTIGAVGGPNINPPDEPFWRQISGYIFLSYLTSGEQQYRYLPVRRFVDKELQGVNMIIRKDILRKLGGFTNKFNYGDDTKIVSEIRKLGYTVVSDPSVVVYHHRRDFPLGHLRQIHMMGKHRGYFVRVYPETNALIYFVPVILTFGLFGGMFLAYILPFFRFPMFALFAIFYFVAVVSVIRYSNIKMACIAGAGIIMTHITYGLSFIQGYLTKKMKY